MTFIKHNVLIFLFPIKALSKFFSFFFLRYTSNIFRKLCSYRINTCMYIKTHFRFFLPASRILPGGSHKTAKHVYATTQNKGQPALTKYQPHHSLVLFKRIHVYPGWSLVNNRPLHLRLSCLSRQEINSGQCYTAALKM